MSMQTQPDRAAFKAAYEAGRPQVVWTSLIADLETPVSAMLKLAEGKPYSFLLESVEGGAARGRYSIIGLRPDVVWRCFGDRAEINRRVRADRAAFEPTGEPALESLRALVRQSRIDLPPDLPPMAAGLFGHMGYDMVRLMERLPAKNVDRLALPDAVYLRPTLTAIFDNIADRVTIVTPVYPSPEIGADQAFDAALERLADTVSDFERGIGHAAPRTAGKSVEPRSNVTRETYHDMVRRAKEYIAAGDIFQVVPSQRFEVPFDLPPFALYRALRRLNPSPFLFFVQLDGYALVGSSPEILVRLTRRHGHHSTCRRDAATRRDPRGGRGACSGDAGRPEGAGRALDAARSGPQRRRPGGRDRLGQGDREDGGRALQPRDAHRLERRGAHQAGARCPGCPVAGFPAGTVSGAPKVRAMEIIEELEPERRGFYAGTVGYFGADGSMDTCIALRTALVRDGKIYLQAGGGVVADSDPEAEYQETLNKAKALVRAAEEAVRFASRS